jgi:hypothetical protein
MPIRPFGFDVSMQFPPSSWRRSRSAATCRAPARLFACCDPEAMAPLLTGLADYSAEHLIRRLRDAG